MFNRLLLQASQSGLSGLIQLVNQWVHVAWAMAVILIIVAVLFFYFRDWHGRSRW